MVLIKCPDCNHDVSTTAKSCPNCGYKITFDDIPHPKKPFTFNALIISIPVIFVICAVTVFVMSILTEIITGIRISTPGALIIFIIVFLLLTSGAVSSYLKDRKSNKEVN